MICPSCGANNDERIKFSCNFCGGSLRAGLSEEQELRALDELRQAAAGLSVEKEANFWRSAYVPHAWGSSTKAFAEAIQGVSDESEVSRSLYARGEAIYSAITLNHLSEPVMHQAQPIMKTNLEKAYQRAFATRITERETEEENTKLVKYMMIGLPFMICAMALMFWAVK